MRRLPRRRRSSMRSGRARRRRTIAVSQTALAAAEQALANTYAGVPNILNDAYAKSNDAVRNQLAAFFPNPERNNPQLTFSVSDSQVLNNINRSCAFREREPRSVAGENWRATSASFRTARSMRRFTSASNYLLPVQGLMNNAHCTALTDEVNLSASTVATYKTSRRPRDSMK